MPPTHGSASSVRNCWMARAPDLMRCVGRAAISAGRSLPGRGAAPGVARPRPGRQRSGNRASAWSRARFSSDWTAWLLGDGVLLASTSRFSADPASSVSIATSCRAWPFSVARYPRRRFAARHSKIRRSQPAQSCCRSPPEALATGAVLRQTCPEPGLMPRSCPGFGPDHLVSDHQADIADSRRDPSRNLRVVHGLSLLSAGTKLNRVRCRSRPRDLPWRGDLHLHGFPSMVGRIQGSSASMRSGV